MILQSISVFIPGLSNTPVGTIILGMLAVLVIIFSLYLAFCCVKLSYWIASQSCKATFLGLAITFYTLWNVFVTIPFGMLMKEREFSEIFDSYVKNIEQIILIFYPKKEDEKKKTEKAKCCSKTGEPKVEQITTKTPEYFCSKCGDKFTDAMHERFSVKTFTFCERCGLKFVNINGKPAPVE